MMTRIISGHTVFKIVFVLLLIGVLVMSFLPPNLLSLTRWDLGHPVAYASLVISTMLALPRRTQTLWIGAGVMVSISLLGLLIELLQPLAGRTTSVVDFANNEVGIAGGIAILCGYFIVERARTKGSNNNPADR